MNHLLGYLFILNNNTKNFIFLALHVCFALALDLDCTKAH